MVPTEEIVFLYVTTKDVEEAKKIGKALLQESLVACANILPGMVSLYEWKSELREDSEAVLLLKTSRALLQSCESQIVLLHSYETPCIVTLPINDIHSPYLKWVKESLRS